MHGAPILHVHGVPMPQPQGLRDREALLAAQEREQGRAAEANAAAATRLAEEERRLTGEGRPFIYTLLTKYRIFRSIW